MDLTEGVRRVWKDPDGLPRAALHVRASITEPLIRIIAESRSPDEARALAEGAAARVTGD